MVRNPRDLERELASAKVRVLLTSLTDVLPAAGIAKIDGAPGHAESGSVALQFDPVFREGSYSELLRCLGRLREAERLLHAAVRGRYLLAERRVLTLTVRRHRWGATIDCPPGVEVVSGMAGITGKHARALCRVWSPSVDLEAAAEGVDWLAGDMFGGRWHEIEVPGEMMELVA